MVWKLLQIITFTSLQVSIRHIYNLFWVLIIEPDKFHSPRLAWCQIAYKPLSRMHMW